MQWKFVAAFAALLSASAAAAQAPAPTVDYSIAVPTGGTWIYSPAPDGSEAIFLDPSARLQIVVRCARAARQVTIARPASGAAPFLYVWTSTLSRSLPASYNPATARLTATLTAWDPLLDALAFSRGRIAVGVPGQALVVPAWPEPARVIEECRG